MKRSTSDRSVDIALARTRPGGLPETDAVPDCHDSRSSALVAGGPNGLRRWLFPAALITLSICDIVVTRHALALGLREGNPVMRLMITSPTAWVIKLGAVCGLIVFGLRRDHKPSSATSGRNNHDFSADMCRMSLIMALVLLWNVLRIANIQL